MTVAGWLFLVFGWGIVLGVTLWCFYLIYAAPEE